MAEAVTVLDALEPIAERVAGVKASHFRQAVIGRHGDAHSLELEPAGGWVVYEKGRVSFAGGSEVKLNA